MRHRCCVFVGLVLLLVGVGGFTIGCGSSSSGNAKVRLVNANPDQSSLDLFSDDTPTDNTDNRKVVVSGVAYGAASAYTGIGASSHIMYVQPTGSSTAIINTTMNFSSGSDVTIISANYSYNPTSIVLNDDNSAPPSGDFKVRIVNCSPGMGAQDVYIVSSGTDINSSNPVFSSLGFGSASSYVTLTAGTYNVVFTPPGSKFINLTSSNTLSSGQIRTVLSLNDPLGSYQAAVLSDAN